MLEWRSTQEGYGKATTTYTHQRTAVRGQEAESKIQEDLSRAMSPREQRREGSFLSNVCKKTTYFFFQP